MYVERDISEKFAKLSQTYSIIALVGARQAGKSTFLKEWSKGTSSSYVLFDDPDSRALFDGDIKKFERQYLEGRDFAVLDEVQYCKDAGSKLKYLADMGRKLFISSSSEILLGKDVLSFLVGRVSVLRLYPFCYSEFLRAKGIREAASKEKERAVWEHCIWGGYPKAVLSDEQELKKTILFDLYQTMVLKDVARTFAISDVSSLERLSKYLSHGIGGIASYERICMETEISFPTLKKYLDVMEKSYLIIRVLPYFTNKLKEMAKRPKIYFLDTGLRNAIAGNFPSEPDGPLFENYVLTELLKLGFSVKYWRTKGNAEVDFVIEKEGELIPLEVKLNAEAGRVETGLRSFISSYKPKRALLIFYNGKEGKVLVDGCSMEFISISRLEGLFREQSR